MRGRPVFIGSEGLLPLPNQPFQVKIIEQVNRMNQQACLASRQPFKDKDLVPKKMGPNRPEGVLSSLQ